jgi:transposase
MRRARLEGQQIGRKPLDVDRTAIVQDRLSGISLTNVAKRHNVSRATVCRLVRLAGGQAELLPGGQNVSAESRS